MPRDQVEDFQELARAVGALHPSRSALSVGHQRLLMLADFLEQVVPPQRFSIGEWGEGGDPANIKEAAECGFVGCALGWAGVIPAFREAGYTCGEAGPWFEGHFSYAAAELFFGIPESAAQRLFSTTHNPAETTAREVAANIRRAISSRRSEA